jgi:hypothetical protein
MVKYYGEDYELTTLSPTPQTASIISISSLTPSVTENTGTVRNLAGTQYSDDINYEMLNPSYVELSEETKTTLSVNLVCSISGSTPISYSFRNNGENIVPDWVTLNVGAQTLDIATPSVDEDSLFTFKIIATVSGYELEQSISLKVKDDSGHLNFVEKFLQGTTQASIGIAVGAVGITSIAALSTPMLMWSTINVYQLFLLLTIVGVTIPDKILAYIYGMEFTAMSFSFVSLWNVPGLSHLHDYFFKQQNNENLEELGVITRSTIINHFNLLVLLVIFTLLR